MASATDRSTRSSLCYQRRHAQPRSGLGTGSEETIVRDILHKYLNDRGYSVTHSIVKTKRKAGGPAYKGGVVTWGKVERDIVNLLGARFDVLTTMLDYYAFPAEAPGMEDRPHGSPVERVEHVEQALRRHFDNQHFIPHLILHETEAWVFAARDQFALQRNDPALAKRMKAIVDAAGGEELINDWPDTTPAKRLLELYPEYRKASHGPSAISELGIDALRARCPHLDAWLRRLRV